MKDNDRKKKKIIIAIIGVLVLLVVVGSATYAFFSATDTEEAKQITTAKEELDIKIKGSTHVSNIKPTNEFWVSGSKVDITTDLNNENIDVATIPVTVTNNSTIDINYNLYVSLEGLKLNSTLTGGTSEDIKWALYKLDNEDGKSKTPETFGDFYDPEQEQKMLYEVKINPEDTHYYLLYIYIEENGENQNRLQNVEFDVKIKGDTKPLNIAGKKLKDVILENNVVKDREPNYKLSSLGLPYTLNHLQGVGVTNLDKGLFRVQTEDKSKNIYYFRGVLPDGNNGIAKNGNGNGNYVSFGTYKDNDKIFGNSLKGYQIFWQIVRINEDGSIVLVATDDIVDINTFKWETDSGNPDYEGSNIQEILNEWFNNTFSEKEKDMIKETTYCNDRSDNYNAVSKRLNKENPEPTLECKDEKDNITSKIGLLTADEVVMAGGFTQDYLNSNHMKYIYNKYGEVYLKRFFHGGFTMSPASNNSYYFTNPNILDSELINDEIVNTKTLYPVITLNPDVKISEGFMMDGEFYPSKLGTYENPYAIEVEE